MVTITVTLPGHTYQTPRRGSGLSRSQEGGPGVWPPFKAPEADSNTPSSPERCSADPARRSSKHGGGALFRDEKRRLLRIEQDVLFHKTEVEGGVTALPPHLVAPLALGSDNVTTSALVLALSDKGREVQVTLPEPAAAAAWACRKCKRPTQGHSGPTG